MSSVIQIYQILSFSRGELNWIYVYLVFYLRLSPIIFTQKLAGNVPTWDSFGTSHFVFNGRNAGDIGSSQWGCEWLCDVQT